MTPAKEYLRDAAECRELAIKVTSPIDKAHWLKRAEQWQIFAQEAERYPQAF